MTPVTVPIDLAALDAAAGRLERALALVTTIRTAGRELAELIDTDDHDGTVVAALEPAHALEAIRPDDHHEQAPAAPPSPPRPDSAPADPPSADDEPPAAPPAAPSSPPPGPTPPNVRHAKPDVLAYLEARPGEWVAIADLQRTADLEHHSMTALRQAVRRLATDGKLEHNGKPTSASRYRFPPVDAEPEQGDADAAATGPAADPQPEPPAAPASSPPAARAPERTRSFHRADGEPAYPVSPRVRRELAREQAQPADPTDPRAGTLEGRITEALQGGGPAGIRELARRIGRAHPDEPLVQTLAILVRHGDVRRLENPHRAQTGQENPLFEVIA